MGRKPKRKRHLTHTLFCEWCGERFEASREDAKTCGGKCRLRLSRFIQKVGFAPDEQPGNRTVEQVYLELVQWLLVREQARRAAQKAIMEQEGAFLLKQAKLDRVGTH